MGRRRKEEKESLIQRIDREEEEKSRHVSRNGYEWEPPLRCQSGVRFGYWRKRDDERKRGALDTREDKA